MSTILISVVICSYNREKYITGAVDSLVTQDFNPASFEIFVVDNNSKDQTEKYCKEYIASHPTHQIYYLNESRQGSSFARNTGSALAQGELLIFMDDDAQALPGFLNAAWNFHIKNPDIVGFGGRIIPRFIPAAPVWMSYYVSSLVGNFDYGPQTIKFAQNKFPLESNMAVSRKAFLSIKGFSESLPGVKGNLRIGGEGKDLYFRLIECYGPIYYVADMIVNHVVEVDKLTPEYLYRVASGIGRGERLRISNSYSSYLFKWVEYLFKLAASVLIGMYYFISGTPAKTKPVIQFRIDVIKGFMGK